VGISSDRTGWCGQDRIGWLRENSANYSKRTLLIPIKGELSGAEGALGDYIANGNIGSEKGKQAERDGPVLALGPTLKLLDTAIRTADGQSLAIVEHIPHSLDGWAAATGAINLATGESTPRVPDEIHEALVDLQREGNNGYPTPRKGTSYGTMVKSLIAELKEHGYSGEFVATYLGGPGRVRQHRREPDEDLPLADMTASGETGDTQPAEHRQSRGIKVVGGDLRLSDLTISIGEDGEPVAAPPRVELRTDMWPFWLEEAIEAAAIASDVGRRIPALGHV
jgi:hypothetical protein